MTLTGYSLRIIVYEKPQFILIRRQETNKKINYDESYIDVHNMHIKQKNQGCEIFCTRFCTCFMTFSNHYIICEPTNTFHAVRRLVSLVKTENHRSLKIIVFDGFCKRVIMKLCSCV